MRAGKRGGRRGIDAILTTILLVLLVIASVGGAWFFFSKMQGKFQSSGEGSAEEQIETTGGMLSIDSAYSREVYIRNVGRTTLRTFDLYLNEEKLFLTTRPEPLTSGQSGILKIAIELKKGDWVKVISDKSVIASYKVERTKTARCGNLRCEFPSEESCTSCPEDCGYCTDFVSARMYPKNTQVGGTLTIELSLEAKMLVESAIARMSLPNRTVEEIPMRNAGGLWSVTRVSDQTGLYVADVRVKEKNGPFLPDVRAGISSTSGWGSNDWKRRKAIMASEGVGFERVFEYVRANFTGLVLSSGSCREVKITDIFGNPRPSQVIDGGSDWCEMIAPLDALEGVSDQIIGFIYYDNPSPPGPGAPTDLLPFDNSTKCAESGNLRLCFGGADDGGMRSLSSSIVGKDTNLLSAHTRDSKYYRSGIQPQMDYPIGLDLLWCSNYTSIGSPEIIVGGGLYQRVRYDLGVTCSGTEYNYRIFLDFYSNKSFYDFSAQTLSEIETGKGGESVLFAPNWNMDAVYFTQEGTTCSGDACFYWSDLLKSPADLGIGATPIENSQYVLFESLTPPHTYKVPEGSSIPPGELLYRVRTFLATRDDIFFNAISVPPIARNPISSSVYLGEEEIA
ncbi:MAG: hypothetical protein V1820_02975 [archaeon]